MFKELRNFQGLGFRVWVIGFRVSCGLCFAFGFSNLGNYYSSESSE